MRLSCNVNGIWMKLSSNVKSMHNDVVIVNSLYIIWENTNTSLIMDELQRVIIGLKINMWSITQNSQPDSKVANIITQNSQPDSKVVNIITQNNHLDSKVTNTSTHKKWHLTTCSMN